MLEQRIALTISFGLAPGATLNIFPIDSIIPAGMDEMAVLLNTVPGVSHGTIARVSGITTIPWGSVSPNTFTVGDGNDRIFGGEGFQYVNNGTGDGTTESIPVQFRDPTGFTTANDTIQITISSHLTPPTITTQPNPFIQIPPGGTATMSVLGAGTPAPTYQWYSGLEPDTSNPIAGATSTSYTTTALSAVQQYDYWVQVKNSGGVADSNDVTVQVATPTSVATSNVSTTFSTAANSVSVSATVNPAENVGNVTYTVPSLGLTAKSATVSNGQAGNTSLGIPAGTGAGAYALDAEYDAPAGIASSNDSKTLTINPASTSLVENGSPSGSTSTSSQAVNLAATVTSSAGVVNEGTVTFTVMSGATVIGTPVTSGTVSNGAALAIYTLPANATAGVYSIHAAYNPGADYTGSSDATHNITVAPLANASSAVITTTTPTLTIAGVGFSSTTSADTITLSSGRATVSAATSTSIIFAFGAPPAVGTLDAMVSVNGVQSAQVSVAIVQLLPVWMTPGGAATWNQLTQSLIVTGAATMIGDPLAIGDHPIIAVASGGDLAITPSSVHQLNVGGMNVSTGGLARLTQTAGAPTVLTVASAGIFNVTGKIDLATNDLDIANGNLASVQALVSSGTNFAGGSLFNGNAGIIDSIASGDTTRLTAIGVLLNNQNGTPLFSSTRPFEGITPGAADVLVKYTYFGDANLDGVVDGSDYSLVDSSFLSEKSGPAVSTWLGGDFNLDQTVNGSDYTLIDNAYNRQGRSLSAAVDFVNGFANAGAAITTNGSASIVGSALQLTPLAVTQAGSAFFTNKLSVAQFHTSFTFTQSAGAGTGDGFAFVIQNNAPTTLGLGGGGLGYQGSGNSIAIKFDLYNNAGEGSDSTGLFTGGAAPYNIGSVDLSSTGIDLHAGHPIRADISYSAGVMNVVLTDTITGAVATQAYNVNIAAAVGGPTAYFGFTGGTGGAIAQQQINNWTVFGS